MTILGDVKVLEDWLQVDADVLNCDTVLSQDLLHFVVVAATGQVLAASEKGVVLSHGRDAGRRGLVDSGDRKSSVDVSNEVSVAEEALGISRLVLLGESLEFVIRQGEVHGREN